MVFNIIWFGKRITVRPSHNVKGHPSPLVTGSVISKRVLGKLLNFSTYIFSWVSAFIAVNYKPVKFYSGQSYYCYVRESKQNHIRFKNKNRWCLGKFLVKDPSVGIFDCLALCTTLRKAMPIYRQFRAIHRQVLAPQHGFMRVYSRTRVRNLAVICHVVKIFTF